MQNLSDIEELANTEPEEIETLLLEDTESDVTENEGPEFEQEPSEDDVTVDNAEWE